MSSVVVPSIVIGSSNRVSLGLRYSQMFRAYFLHIWLVLSQVTTPPTNDGSGLHSKKQAFLNLSIRLLSAAQQHSSRCTPTSSSISLLVLSVVLGRADILYNSVTVDSVLVQVLVVSS